MNLANLANLANLGKFFTKGLKTDDLALDNVETNLAPNLILSKELGTKILDGPKPQT